MNNNIISITVITCPACGHQKKEQMPSDACVVRYNCEKCNFSLKPKAGDCCVFCSYGSIACPPVQKSKQQKKYC